MNIASEIVHLTPKSVSRIMDSGSPSPDRRSTERSGNGRRKVARWMIAGMVEFRDRGEPMFGLLQNITDEGLSMMCEQEIDVGTRIEMSVHAAGGTVVGHGTILGCHDAGGDWFVRIGFEF